MAGVELQNFKIKVLELWNAGHDALLTVECRAGKATNNLQLSLGNKPPPPPPACQVRPQLWRQGPSHLGCHERRAEDSSAAANTAVAPKVDASEATDNSEFHTAAVNAADTTDAATLKKPTGKLTDRQTTLLKTKSKLKLSRSQLLNCLLTLLILNLLRSLFHLEEWLIRKKGLEKLWCRFLKPKQKWKEEEKFLNCKKL